MSVRVCCEPLEDRKLLAAVTLTASVGAGGVNRPGDVREVQQRLRDLNFRGSDGALLDVDGIVGPLTISCIKLFQAAIDPQGDGDPASKDGRVDVNGETNKWLNATNAPTWVKLVDPDGAGGQFDIYRGTAQPEVWGTSWAVNMIKEACRESAGTEIITAISTSNGTGSSQWHATHRSGMDIDVNIDAAGRVVGSGALTVGEQRVIDDMKAFYAAAAPAFITNIWVGFSRIVNGFNNQTGTSLAHLDSGNVHDTHFHVDLRPPARAAAPAGTKTLDETAPAPKPILIANLAAPASIASQVFSADKDDILG
jgi:peptidoglycan hydrolase-like protein with peptidoglycan-binding domain